MNGFQWFLKSIGIDLSPDGIKEMFSKVTADDIRKLVTELGLNPDEILAMPKIVAVKLQEFEQRQIRILQLLEAMSHDRYSGRYLDASTDFQRPITGTNNGSANHPGSGGDVTDGVNNG